MSGLAHVLRKLEPPLQYHALFEWSHRATGVLVGVAIILTVAWILRKHRRSQPLLWLVGFSLLLIAVVGGIGGSLVITKLNPAIRTLHLGLAEMVPVGLVGALVFVASSGGELERSAPDGRSAVTVSFPGSSSAGSN